MNKKIVCVVICINLCLSIFAAAAKEGGGSNRGSYLSNSGYILTKDDIVIDNYIAERDYNYPIPQKNEISVTTATGNKEGFEYVLLGLKGKKEAFEEVPPLNISFCIDRSGSMDSVMPWVQASFYIFIDSIRNGDIVSLVDMNTDAQILIPPMQITSVEDRRKFKNAVDTIYASGGTDVYAGIKKSYEQIELQDTSEYLNRVIILTDGMHNSGEMINKDIVDFVKEKRKTGINISTIILGLDAQIGLMNDVAEHGGGSSRFISNHDEMVKVFETELDRMLIPVAREVEMRFELKDGIKLNKTWGYQNNIENNTVTYFLPTLHNGDYETIFAEYEIDKSFTDNTLGTFFVNYTDLHGNKKELGPFDIKKSAQNTGNLIEDERVREVEGIISYTRVLNNIAEKTNTIIELEYDMYQYLKFSPQYDDLVAQIMLELNQNLQLVDRIRKELTPIDESLGGGVYEKYYTLLNNYEKTFTDSLASYKKSIYDRSMIEEKE